MIRIHIEKRLKAYNGIQVLRIEKTVTPGSILRVTGPSGAGKTTLLKMIAGLIAPDAGTIAVGDAVWYESAMKINFSPQQRQPGFVFQDYALFPNMTVLQHLQYATQDAAWITRLLAIGQLQTFAHHKPAHLSGGQQQRLAILRALAIRPRLLLMDEPFSALDVKMKTRLIADLLLVIKELNATAIIVSHNQQELDGICNDELVLGGEE
ncbi:sulfate/molybdate ABC transporter ATP-binding protein [Mucilaginibacter psychrotolerans]|uniref:ATP-binding cassette domain-containing protein n=1 Tax=Mucilaginibacter psychrotolerans TaxID=1524096 RepID=A0A4Y8S6Q0_9SPHI|nr:ATP-binding cassette domain-containing protein [Mucilaginibacter psychrotolerans]TFF34054.1 ATP-binding cassette domain-containing protein [Mucilaginibacter psychrotolerans]